MPLSHHVMKKQEDILPLHQQQRLSSVISLPPQRPPPRFRRPKSYCMEPTPQVVTGEVSFAVARHFNHCPVTKRRTRSFEDTKLRIPVARQRVAYLENQYKCYAKADSDMTKWIRRVSVKGPPSLVLEGYIPSQRQLHSSLDALSSQRRPHNSNIIGPRPSTSFGTALTTFLRKASGGSTKTSTSTSTHQSHNPINETPRPSLSRMFQPPSISRLSISISTKRKATIAKEKAIAKTTTSRSSASPLLYVSPVVSPPLKEQQQQQTTTKRWRPISIMGPPRIPSSTKSASTGRPISMVTVGDCRLVPREIWTVDRRWGANVAENPKSFSQSMSQHKRTVVPSLAPMYISTACR